MRFRLVIGMIVGGLALGYYGQRELRVGWGADSTPAAVELGALEDGAKPSSNYVRIGPHLRMYPECLYEYEDEHNLGDTPSSKVTKAYYPIISTEHPFLKRLGELGDRHGGLEKVPDDANWPEIRNFAVLVKTKKFRRIGDIPDTAEDSESIAGLFVNDIESLGSEELKLLKEGFPGLDFSKVLILEAGRTPTSAGAALGMLAGAAALIVVGAFVGLAGRNKPAPPMPTGAPGPAMPPQPQPPTPATLQPPLPQIDDKNPYSQQ